MNMLMIFEYDVEEALREQVVGIRPERITAALT
jgi:hypothetical protein